MRARPLPPPVLQRVEGSGTGRPWEAAVVIPAREASEQIAECIAALAGAVATSGVNVGIVLCVHDSTDDTARRGAAALRAQGLSNLVLDMRFLPGTGGTGRVRDLGMTLSQRFAHPPAALLTSDADSRVAPDWIAANLDELRRSDVVFGTVLPDPALLAAMPARFARLRAQEAHYTRAALRLVHRLDPLLHDPMPRHRTQSSASLALSAAAFRRLGGVPWQPVAEDRALALRAEALDLRIRHAPLPNVVRQGRDGPCDDWLEPPDALMRRYFAKGRLRALWPAPASVQAAVEELLGPAPRALPQHDAFASFGAYWQRLEDTHPALARQPLRRGELARALPDLLDRLRQLERKHPAARSGAPPRSRTLPASAVQPAH